MYELFYIPSIISSCTWHSCCGQLHVVGTVSFVGSTPMRTLVKSIVVPSETIH